VDSSAMGNSPAMTRGRGAREDSGVEGPDRCVPAISVGGGVMRGRLGSCAEMGLEAVEAGWRRGKRPTKLFLFWNSYPI
jgi:hypothetical protein